MKEPVSQLAYDAMVANLAPTTKATTTFTNYVVIEGVRFDADDLYETLSAVSHDQVTTQFSRDQTAVLKLLGILKYEGNSRCYSAAELGPNGESFLSRLREANDAAESAKRADKDALMRDLVHRAAYYRNEEQFGDLGEAMGDSHTREYREQCGKTAALLDATARMLS